MQRLFLVRHGKFLHQGFSGHFPESELSPIGERQAELTGKWLAELPNPPSLIYTSTMRRAKQTAELIAGCLSKVRIHSLDDLRECNQSQIPLPTNSEYDGTTKEAPGPFSAFQRLFQPVEGSATRLIVCHGNIICYFLARIDPDTLWRYVAVPNCSLTSIDIEADGQLRIASFADSEHSPAEHQDE